MVCYIISESFDANYKTMNYITELESLQKKMDELYLDQANFDDVIYIQFVTVCNQLTSLILSAVLNDERLFSGCKIVLCSTFELKRSINKYLFCEKPTLNNYEKTLVTYKTHFKSKSDVFLNILKQLPCKK